MDDRFKPWVWPRRRLLISVIAVCVVGSGTWTFRSFVRPAQDNPQSADAVVVYAGGPDNERIGRALQLMTSGVAPILVISEGNRVWAEGTDVERLCAAGSDSFEVVCVSPDPDNTVGESVLFAELAEGRGWDHLVLVTSRAHLSRASLWLDRCFSGSVSRVGSPPSGSNRYVHEILGTVHALTLDRHCPEDSGGFVSAEWDKQPTRPRSPANDRPQGPDGSVRVPSAVPSPRLPSSHDASLSECQDWVGRRFVMSVYSVPVNNPATRSVDDLAQEGYTHVGPWYEEDRWESGERAAQIGLCTIFPVGAPVTKEEALSDIQGTLDQVSREIRTVLANTELNESVSMWSILPEELNTYRPEERELFLLLAELIRESDPLGRPVYMYLQSNADELQFEEASLATGVLGQGNYLSTNGLEDQRVYLKASVLRSIAAREAMGEFDDAVMPIVEHRIHSGTLDPNLSPLIETWVRHDLFTAIANGSDGFIAFSGFPPKEGQSDFARYNDAYTQVVGEIRSAGLLELYEAGAVGAVQQGTVVEGPKTLSIPVLFLPDRGNPIEELDSFSLRSWSNEGRQTIVIVNHANESISLEVTGVESSDVDGVVDLLSQRTLEVRDEKVTVSLPSLGVAVLSYDL